MNDHVEQTAESRTAKTIGKTILYGICHINWPRTVIKFIERK